MITKAALKDYPNLQPEIDRLEDRIRRGNMQQVVDTVNGSSTGHPYTQHAISIVGAVPGPESIAGLKQRREKLIQQKSEIENFVNGLPTSRQRQIVWMHIEDGLTWDEVAARIGKKSTAESVRKEFSRVLNNAGIK